MVTAFYSAKKHHPKGLNDIIPTPWTKANIIATGAFNAPERINILNIQREHQNELPAETPGYPHARVVERKITVSNTEIHMKSVFIGQTSLDDAYRKIIARKLMNSKK